MDVRRCQSARVVGKVEIELDLGDYILGCGTREHGVREKFTVA